MAEYDIPTLILTGAVALTTFFVYRATKAIAKATTEVGAYSIRPRISVVGHTKIGSDDKHNFYEFRFLNNGVGNAFDLSISIFHTNGATLSPITSSLGINASPPRVIDKTIDKDTKGVKFKISYRDLADHPYVQEFYYSLDDDDNGYTIQA